MKVNGRKRTPSPFYLSENLGGGEVERGMMYFITNLSFKFMRYNKFILFQGGQVG